jgi:hypothetical protein
MVENGDERSRSQKGSLFGPSDATKPNNAASESSGMICFSLSSTAQVSQEPLRPHIEWNVQLARLNRNQGQNSILGGKSDDHAQVLRNKNHDT